MGVMGVRAVSFSRVGLLTFITVLMLMMPGTALSASMIFRWDEAPGRYPWSPNTYELGSVSRRAAVDYSGYCPGCGIDGSDEYYNVGDRETSSLILGTWSGNAVSNGVRAGHESTVEEQRVDFRGTANSGYGDNWAESRLTLTFQVDEAGAWWLDGDDAASTVLARLYADGQEVHSAYGTRPWLSEERRRGDRYSFWLVPGVDYELALSLESYGGQGYTEEGEIVWSVVPEPGTALLIGLGLGLLSVRRRFQ